MQSPTKKLENKLFATGYQQIIAIDEVGMGCLAGPVVVCAVMTNKKFFQKPYRELSGVRDSKLLSPNQRENLDKKLRQTSSIRFKICLAQPKTIDRLNIYQTSRMAMRRAIHQLAKRIRNSDTIVLVDGSHKIPNLNFDQIPIIKGDRKVFSIACASIIAKVYRDKMMTKYAKKYPNYGFEKHKGYGTKHHIVQLIAHGPSAIHRKSFAPVSKLG